MLSLSLVLSVATNLPHTNTHTQTSPRHLLLGLLPFASSQFTAYCYAHLPSSLPCTSTEDGTRAIKSNKVPRRCRTRIGRCILTVTHAREEGGASFCFGWISGSLAGSSLLSAVSLSRDKGSRDDDAENAEGQGRNESAGYQSRAAACQMR